MVEKIFVSIASYRDDECSLTLQSLFKNAKIWDRCYAGICQQNSKTDEDCLKNINDIINGFDNDNKKDNDKDNEKIYNDYRKNIRIIRISHKEAKGPTYARFLCSSLWDGEDYYFQIDSHTTFTKDWDEKLINMVKEIKERKLSLKPVISHYPIDKENIYKNETQVPHIKSSQYDSNGVLILSTAAYTDTNNDYLRTCYMSAGMFFCEASFLNEIPFDPTLDYLFMGEEILTSVRFYTYGWDVFTPKINIIYHEYTRKDKPKYHDDNKEKFDNTKAIEKVKAILNKDNNDYNVNYEYGLGKIRSLDDFYKNCEIINNTNNQINDNNNNDNKRNKKYNIYLLFLLLIIIIIVVIIFFFIIKSKNK